MTTTNRGSLYLTLPTREYTAFLREKIAALEALRRVETNTRRVAEYQNQIGELRAELAEAEGQRR